MSNQESNTTEHNPRNSHVTDLDRTISNATSTVSSGYESEGGEQHVFNQTGGGIAASYHLIPAFNPVLVQQPVMGGTNARPLSEQYYSMLPGQPYTAPIMVATKEQLDYALCQQLNTQSSDFTTVYRQRQYSGPVLAAMPPTNNTNVKPTNIPFQVDDLPPSISCNSDGVPGTDPEAQRRLDSSAIQHESPEPPLNTDPQPFSAKSRSSSLDTHNLIVGLEEKEKPHRRNTSPSISSQPYNQMREGYKRLPAAAFLMKEKNLYEEEENTPSVPIGEDFGGYDYQFLLSHDELHDVTCPICQLVLCEPFLTTCCGSHFCKNCIGPLLLKHGLCPMCNNDDLQGIVDRRTERKINSLPVRCTKSSMGCNWTGSLTDLHNHLSLSTGTCSYVIVSCPLGCGEDQPLSGMKQHQEEACPRRIHQCKFCSYRGVYEEMPKRHWPECEGYPVPCPHNCSVNDMARKLLTQHLLECPKRSVQCCYSYAGCTTPLQGDEVQKHMDDNVGIHLNLVSNMVKKLLINWDNQQKAPPIINTKTDTERNTEIIILNRKLNEKEGEILSLKGQLAALQDDNEDTKLDLARMKSMVFKPPFEFRVTNFSEFKQAPKQWFSPPFYTHNQGYKMCVSVDCNGADEGEGTHVSVYANLMRGEFDDSLPWPFTGVITVQLHNQLSNSDHINHEIPFRKNVPLEISGRVVDQELAESGLGVPHFVLHGKLPCDKHLNTEFLKNDELKFCVLKVKTP